MRSETCPTKGPGRVLITGGTRGIGRAIAHELTRQGARVCVTHRWGSVSTEELTRGFLDDCLTPPRVEQCDASDPTQTSRLVECLYDEWGGVDSVVSGVALAAPVSAIADLRRRSLEISLSHTAWPLLDLVHAFLRHAVPPKRFLVLSSVGVERVLPDYDMAAVAKAALETLARYLAARLRTQQISVNVLRLGPIDTVSLRAMLPLGRDVQGCMSVSVAASAAAALLSGLMDGMTGQIITVDEGGMLSGS